MPMMTTRDDKDRRIALLATGGTIAFEGGKLRLDAADLAETIANNLREHRVRIKPYDVEAVPSTALSPSDMLRLLDRARSLVGEFDGIVMTHGTDTLEETAYLFSMHWDQPTPVVITGAMRPAITPGADGPRNLLAACLVAAHDDSLHRGPLAVMHDKIFRGNDITKLHSWDTDTFVANGGLEGTVNPWEEIRYQRAPSERPTPLPRPEEYAEPAAILTVGAGSDGSEVEALLAGGFRGLIVAAAGKRGIPTGMRTSLARARESGAIVVGSSRCPLGGSGLGVDDDGIIWAGDLNPAKARLRLMTGMALWGNDADVIARLFR